MDLVTRWNLVDGRRRELSRLVSDYQLEHGTEGEGFEDQGSQADVGVGFESENRTPNHQRLEANRSETATDQPSCKLNHPERPCQAPPSGRKISPAELRSRLAHPSGQNRILCSASTKNSASSPNTQFGSKQHDTKTGNCALPADTPADPRLDPTTDHLGDQTPELHPVNFEPATSQEAVAKPMSPNTVPEDEFEQADRSWERLEEPLPPPDVLPETVDDEFIIEAHIHHQTDALLSLALSSESVGDEDAGFPEEHPQSEALLSDQDYAVPDLPADNSRRAWLPRLIPLSQNLSRLVAGRYIPSTNKKQKYLSPQHFTVSSTDTLAHFLLSAPPSTDTDQLRLPIPSWRWNLPQYLAKSDLPQAEFLLRMLENLMEIIGHFRMVEQCILEEEYKLLFPDSRIRLNQELFARLTRLRFHIGEAARFPSRRLWLRYLDSLNGLSVLDRVTNRRNPIKALTACTPAQIERNLHRQRHHVIGKLAQTIRDAQLSRLGFEIYLTVGLYGTSTIGQLLEELAPQPDDLGNRETIDPSEGQIFDQETLESITITESILEEKQWQQHYFPVDGDRSDQGSDPDPDLWDELSTNFWQETTQLRQTIDQGLASGKISPPIDQQCSSDSLFEDLNTLHLEADYMLMSMLTDHPQYQMWMVPHHIQNWVWEQHPLSSDRTRYEWKATGCQETYDHAHTVARQIGFTPLLETLKFMRNQVPDPQTV